MEKKYTFMFGNVVILLFCSVSFFSQTKTIPYQQLPTSTGASTGSNIFFGASMTTSNITVNFEGPADRWISLGFGTSMSPTDVLMYGNGITASLVPVGWYDYFINSFSPTVVDIDPIQNWNIISTGTLTNGQRTVTASRPLNTGEANYDVVINYSVAALNIVWARGATADYTIAYHGPGNRAYGISLPWLSPPTASFSAASTTICAGTSLLYTNLTSGGQTTYTWNFQGASPATSTATNPSVTYNTPGTYSVALTASNAIGTNTFTQINYITVTPTIVPSLTITQTTGTNPMCAGASAGFTAAYTNGGSAPGFLWKVNGLSTGVTTSTYTAANFSNAAAITCVLTSNALCTNPATVTSAPITLTVNSTAAVSASISLISGNNPMCNGSPAAFSVTTGNGGSAPAYQWQVNGLNVGNNSSSFSSGVLTNGNVINCLVTSNAPCASTSMALSAGITMTVSSVLVPQVSIGIAGGNNFICAGAPVTLTASPVNGGTAPVFQWLVNGLNSGINNSTFTTSSLNNGATISCVLLSNLSCSSPNTATSSVLTVSVNPVPATPTIMASGSLTFCAGGNVVLNSSAQTGNIWTNGLNTPTIAVNTTGNFTVTQTLNGCISAPSQPISVLVNNLPLVSLQMPVNTICLSSGDLLLNQGLPPGGIYSGTGVNGSFFSPVQSGTGNFMITYAYTDNNSCTGSAVDTLLVDACVSLGEILNEEGEVSVFPNPTSGQITIYSKKEKIISIKLHDQCGRLILTQPGQQESYLTLDLSKEMAGIYVVDIVLTHSVVHKLLSKRD